MGVSVRCVSRSRRRFGRLGAFGAVLALVVAACGSDDDAQPDDAQPNENIATTQLDNGKTPDTTQAAAVPEPEVDAVKVVWLPQALLYAPLVLAQDLGYFEANGLQIESVEINTGAATIVSVSGGDGDVALTDPSGLLQAQSAGAPFKMIAQWGQSAVYELAVSEKFANEHGITEATPIGDVLRSFQGTTIGSSPPGGGLYTNTVAALRTVGLDPDTDVDIVTAGSGSALVAGLEQGTFNAFLYVPPVTTTAQAQSGALIFTLSDLESEDAAFGQAFNNVFFTSDEFLAKAPNALTLLINGYYCGTQYALAHPEEAFAMVQPAYPSADMEQFKALFPSFEVGPVPTQTAYDSVLSIINLAETQGGRRLDVPFDAAVAPALAEAAKDLGCPAE